MSSLTHKSSILSSYINWQQKKLPEWGRAQRRKIHALVLKVKRIGIFAGMSNRDRNKLAIFNFLNFFQLCTGLLLPFFSFLSAKNVPLAAWIFAFLPPLVSTVVLLLNARRQYNAALLV